MVNYKYMHVSTLLKITANKIMKSKILNCFSCTVDLGHSHTVVIPVDAVSLSLNHEVGNVYKG